MSKSRASKLNSYRSAVSRQKNDVYKFKQKRGKKKGRWYVESSIGYGYAGTGVPEMHIVL